MIVPDSDIESLIQRISDPVVVIDQTGTHIVACNAALAALTPYASGESLKGEKVSTIFSFDSNGEESAKLLTGSGGAPTLVRLERFPCQWKGLDATLCFVRPAGQGEKGLGSTATEDGGGELFEYLHEAAEQLEVVNRVIAAVNRSRSIEEVFNLASASVRSLVPFDRASIALCERDGTQLRVFALAGENAGSLTVGSVGPLRGSVTELALQQREMVVIPELSAETRFNVYHDLQREGFRSAVCCPLFSMQGPVGSLNLTSRTPVVYNRRHLLALERLAPPLAIAIEKVRLLELAEDRSRAMEAAARREGLAERIGRRLASTLDPSPVLQETVEALGRALEANRCHLALFEDKDRTEAGALVENEYLSAPCAGPLSGTHVPLHTSRYAQQALSGEQPVAFDDVSELDRDELTELYERLGVRAVLCAPVHACGAGRSGLLEVHDCTGPRCWTKEDCKLLGTVAAQVAVALNNAHLYEASRRRNEELRGLYEISRAFSTLTDTSDIYGRLTRAIAKLVGGEICLIATYDRRRNLVRAESPGYNVPPEVVRDFRFTLDQDDAGAYIYRTGKPFISNEPASDDRLDRNFIANCQIRSVLSVPMYINRELLGFIYVANRQGGFGEREMHLLEIFATQAAETIVNARLFSTIQAQAEREAVVNRLLLSLQQTGDPYQKIQAVNERVGEVLQADRCIATLYAGDETTAFFGEWCAEGIEPISNWVDVREHSPIPRWLKESRRPLVVDNVTEHPLAAEIKDLIEKAGIRSFVVVPIMHQGRIIGSVSAHQTRRPRRWAEDDIDLLVAVATHVGSTLENARLIAELREAGRLKDEFLATISHELRTPLTAIVGWTDLLSENEYLEKDEELADGLVAIRNSTAALTQLISDLLDLSRMQRKALRLERAPCDVNHVVMNAARTVSRAATERRQELSFDLGQHLPPVFVDAQRIQQVIWNLLTNAIKFTPEGGRITVRTRLADETTSGAGDTALPPPRFVVIEVEDTGPGIPKKFLPLIWDRFWQADSSATRRHGGLGIGLTLVKELVEAHHGEVEAASEATGTIFTVRLPVTVAGDEFYNGPLF